jgi:CHAT domain-containing protein
MFWIGGIAAVVVIALLVPAIRRSPIEQLVVLTAKTGRIVEPRITGGFSWSPYRGPDRANGAPIGDPDRMKLGGAAGELIEHAQHDAGAEAQHQAGVAMMLTQNPVDAIGRLEGAAKTKPSAEVWSDLAAARYAAASNLGRAALYPQALAASDSALRLDENLPEAAFNRALVLERMGLAGEARAAWTRYLTVDPSSKWAEEARSHLAALPAATKSSQFDRDRPALESAAERGDARSLGSLLVQHAPRASAMAEAEYLGRWGEAARQGNDTDAARWLTIARNIGSAIARDGNDTLLRDAAQTIDGAPAAARQSLAEAHVAYRAGRLAYSRQQLDDAARDLEHAATLFEQARSPMALTARYYAASVHQSKLEGSAGAELERILAAADANPAYRILRARVRWELGRSRMFDYDWPGATALLSESARLFHDAGDSTDEAAVDSIFSYCLAAEGQGDESWTARIAALRALTAEGNAGRLIGAIGSAMRAERVAGRNDAALALARLLQPVAGDAEQLPRVLDALQLRSMLESASGNAEDGLRTARQAEALARGISDPSLRARRFADADVATGAALAGSDPRTAMVRLQRAIDFYRRSEFTAALPEPLLLHARCALQAGDAATAMRDLEDGMSIVEKHPAASGNVLGTGFLDADHALFSEGIRLALDRGENAAAFAIAERSRGASITAAEMQKRLSGSGTALLEIVVMPDQVVTFAITQDDVQVTRRRTETVSWAKLVEESLSESDSVAAARLYDDLIRPAEAVFTRVRNVIIVPDPRLESVPFAALYDTTTGRYLVERVGVAIAASAAPLQREDVRASASVAVLSLPTGGATGTRALPDVEPELAEIAALYRRATSIPPAKATFSALREGMSSADVVHVSGHTERQPAGGEYALLLAGPNGAERTSSRSIAATPFPNARLIVLAACETLRPPASTETHALSLGAAFAASGAAGVIGTLTPIGDRDARTFFGHLHRRLAGGDSAGEALRAAQIAAIDQQKNSGGSRAWRSIQLLTRRIWITKG